MASAQQWAKARVMLLGDDAKLIGGCHARGQSDVDALIVAGVLWPIDLNALPLSHVLA
jgi:hypothetical protein